MIQLYPQQVQTYLQVPAAALNASIEHGPLSFTDIQDQIDGGKPVIAGISPSNPSASIAQHVALIVGYRETDSSQYLIVNDPFPFTSPNLPYELHNGTRVERGRYLIRFEDFRDGLNWTVSFYDVGP